MFKIEEIPSQLSTKTEILALGTDTRQRISWTQKGKLFSLSPEKDLYDLKDFYFKAASLLREKTRLSPSIVTFDPHPNFICKKEAEPIVKKYFPKAKLVPVFHHIAHAANFGIEVSAKRKFIAPTFDGTGFGKDGNVWGGEFLIFDGKSFKRAAHFEYQLLPGNEAAIRDPWRMALGILHNTYSEKSSYSGLGFLKGISAGDVALLEQMLDKKFNCPYTSSVGRLFDAVSALLGLKTTASKEAEAAIILEKAAARRRSAPKSYGFRLEEKDGDIVVKVGELFKGMVSDMRGDIARSDIAYCFHVTLANIVRRVCLKLRVKTGISDIYFCGGVFMNNILVDEIKKVFKKDDAGLFFAKRPQTTDLGISQGQIAAYLMER